VAEGFGGAGGCSEERLNNERRASRPARQPRKRAYCLLALYPICNTRLTYLAVAAPVP
jgi:hypothetical protein